MRKSIITFSLDKRDTTSFFRASPLKFIRHDDLDIYDISDTKIFDWSVFLGHQIFFLQRPFSPDHLNLIYGAKNIGLKVVLDYDDLLTAVDYLNPTHQLYKDHLENHKECLKLADEIWVSTTKIRNEYLQYNKNIHIIPNALNDYVFLPSKKKPFNMDTRKVFWRGGSSHSGDVLERADEIIKVINNNPNWEFNFCGSRFEYIEMRTGDNHQIIPYMSIIEFFRYFNHSNPNACFFPLRNTAFNEAKSNISFLESSYAGSCFFGNKDLPEFNLDCILPIDRLKEIGTMDKEEMRKYNELAWQYVCDTSLLSNINRLRTQRLLEI